MPENPICRWKKGGSDDILRVSFPGSCGGFRGFLFDSGRILYGTFRTGRQI